MKLVLAALVGALVTLAVIGGLAALDRTTLHWYADEERSTLWYYVEVHNAGNLVRIYGDLPPCRIVQRQRPNSLPAEPHASPRTLDDVERVAVECQED